MRFLDFAIVSASFASIMYFGGSFIVMVVGGGLWWCCSG